MGVALAVTTIIEAIIRNEHSVLTVSMMLSGEYGVGEYCLSVPCVVDKKGVSRIVEAGLDQAEESDLKQSAQILKNICIRVA